MAAGIVSCIQTIQLKKQPGSITLKVILWPFLLLFKSNFGLYDELATVIDFVCIICNFSYYLATWLESGQIHCAEGSAISSLLFFRPIFSYLVTANRNRRGCVKGVNSRGDPAALLPEPSTRQPIAMYTTSPNRQLTANHLKENGQ